MIEQGHLEAYRFATENALKATQNGQDADADVAETQMRAIRELEKARREIFDRFNIPDITPIKVKAAEKINLSAIIRNQMAQQNLQQRGLAQQSGISEATVSRIVRGVFVPKEDTAMKIIGGLGLTPDDPNAQLILKASKPKALRNRV